MLEHSRSPVLNLEKSQSLRPYLQCVRVSLTAALAGKKSFTFISWSQLIQLVSNFASQTSERQYDYVDSERETNI